MNTDKVRKLYIDSVKQSGMSLVNHAIYIGASASAVNHFVRALPPYDKSVPKTVLNHLGLEEIISEKKYRRC